MRVVSLNEVSELRDNGETVICRDLNDDKLFHIVYPNDTQINGTDPDSMVKILDYIWYARDNN